MVTGDLSLLLALMFAAAVVYAAVGHAGASGYIAAMALCGVAPLVMRPTALTLNILVAGLATVRWHRAGHVNWRALLPLVAASIPAAFIGGAIVLPALWYRILVGCVLALAGLRLLVEPRNLGSDKAKANDIPWASGAATGALVGVLSGLTGTGGGIFLSPLLLMFGWAGARGAAGITAPFILVNSIAGLAGNLLTVASLPAELPYLVIVVLAGALIGTQIGIRWVSIVSLQRLLGVVLLVAAAKFLWV